MTQVEAPDSHRLVQLRFKPLWLYVDTVREFCGFFAKATFDDDAIGERVAVVVHELVENAIRYGNDKELELRIERGVTEVLVRVANTTSDEQAENLKRTFAELHRVSAAEAYVQALKRAATLPETQSGLGLARIRHEGRVNLDLSITPGRVCITARGVP
ncbi:MAG TPA: hypothetical protein VH142_18150 [Polyangiaceae bacterium]|jgi:hypothetical protein|nr:hypothetical protein [Polyangiaceae bacterium]